MSEAETVLSFWFGEPVTDPETLMVRIKRWFMGGPDLDREIAEKFAGDLSRARNGELDRWADSPRSRLALIILFDQFTRNLHRGSPLSFDCDHKAQALAIGGLDAGMHVGLRTEERMFFAIPLEHAEDLAIQDRSVRTMEELVASAPPNLRSAYGIAVSEANRHRDIIVRFGRFPARNGALGRVSTPEELAFLAPKKT